MKDLVNFFYEVGSLRSLKRAYNLHMRQEVESVSEHIQRTTTIAYLLAKKAGADPYKTMLMAAFHDIPESRAGDLNWHQKQYAVIDENKAWTAQLKLLGDEAQELQEVIREYKERKSLESQLAKDADNIDYVLNLKELALQGNEEAKRRLQEKDDVSQLHIYTKVGLQVMKTVFKSKPNEWYQADRKQTSTQYYVKKPKK